MTEPTAGSGGDEGLRGLSLAALLAGACALIPLPLLDDLAAGLVRRRAVADLLRARGLEATPRAVGILAGLEREKRGCWRWLLLGPLFHGALYVVEKLLRKLLFVFAIHEAVNTASAVFHDTYLLRHALALGTLDGGPARRVDPETARRVRRAIEATIAETDTRPLRRAVRRALRGSGALLRRAAGPLGRTAARRRAVDDGASPPPLAAGEPELDGAVARLSRSLWLEVGYREALERRLEAHLAASVPSGAPPAEPSAPPSSGR